MQDRDDDEISLLDNVQSLKTVAFLLKGLYSQLAEEREAITLASGQMAHAVKQFQSHLTEFENFEKACRKHIVDSVRSELKNSVNTAAREISQQVAENSTQPILQSINTLEAVGSRLEHHFRRHVTEKKGFWLGITAGLIFFTLLGGLLGGFLVHCYLPEIDETTFDRIVAGKILEKSWPRLSEAEKNKIRTLGNNG